MIVLFKLILGVLAFYIICVLMVAFIKNRMQIKQQIDKTYVNIFGQTSFFDDFVFKTVGLIIIGTVCLKVLN